MTTSAMAETMKVASSPSGRSDSPSADQEHRAERGAEDGAPAAEHRRDDDLHADRDVDEGADRGGAHVEDHQRAGEAGEERADQKAASLCLVTLKPSAPACTGSCPLACRISPTGERDRPKRIAPLTAMKPSAIQ